MSEPGDSQQLPVEDGAGEGGRRALVGGAYEISRRHLLQAILAFVWFSGGSREQGPEESQIEDVLK